MKALDFWATDAWTDSMWPIFDDWSITFMLREWTLEVMRDEMTIALGRAEVNLALAEAKAAGR